MLSFGAIDPMAEVISLADRLRTRRDELGISQAQAARELDVARTAYRLWELEAARPAPDRWRLIAHWLGISVSTLLLAEELMTKGEAATSDAVEADFRGSGGDWDEAAALEEGDFFAQARALLQEGMRAGHVTDDQALELTGALDRMETDNAPAATARWQTIDVRKDLLSNAEAPRKARGALGFAAADLPEHVRDDGRLLVSELVSDAVLHSSADTIGLRISVQLSTLRVEVADRPSAVAAKKPRPVAAGLGRALVAAIAARWGVMEREGSSISWFELNLLAPGA